MSTKYREKDDSSESSSEKEEDEYEVEKIIDYRKLIDGTEEYLIRWEGYAPGDDTWEDKENLKCPDKLAEFHREQEKRKSKKTPKSNKKNSRSRSRTFSTVSINSSEESFLPASKVEKKRPSKSTTPSRVVKTKRTSSTSESNVQKATKETTLKDVLSKAPIGFNSTSGALSTPKALSKSPLADKIPSNSKDKSGMSKLFDKNPPGPREVNQIEPSVNSNNPTPSTLIKISKILADNPPILKEEISELSSSFLSTPKLPVFDKTVKAMGAPTTSTNICDSDDSDVIIVDTSLTIGDTVNENIPPSTSHDTVSPLPSKSSTAKEGKNGRKQKHIKKGAAATVAAAAAPVTKNKKKKATEENDDVDINTAEVNKRLWNMATINNSEATIGIIEGRPSNRIMEGPIADSEEFEIPIIPADHKCFGNSPTVFEIAENAVIHNVNNQKMEYVFSKTWKMRCTECTEKYTVNDNTVEYVYCFLTIKDLNYLMIKINKCNSELFLIDANAFRTLSPQKYGTFVCITQEYFDTLRDLSIAIEEQKVAVEESFNNSILEPYKNGGTVDFAILESCPPEVMKSVREIGRLFFLELQLAIGNHMCRVVDVSQLHNFVMDFYENRDQMFKIVRKEAVENIYETLFMSLVSEPAES
uniref:Chromo domain-containing protein n=1 Tax=Panagrolaimus superbus TaxID=310955 RepID=A0A914YQT6_9BILA